MRLGLKVGRKLGARMSGLGLGGQTVEMWRLRLQSGLAALVGKMELCFRGSFICDWLI
jgi:hypothetical protein